MSLDFDSPQFRRAVWLAFGSASAMYVEDAQRLVAELTNDICPTCEYYDRKKIGLPCDNPDCTNGKVKPLLVEPDKHRAEVIAELTTALANNDTLAGCRAADFIERREQER